MTHVTMLDEMLDQQWRWARRQMTIHGMILLILTLYTGWLIVWLAMDPPDNRWVYLLLAINGAYILWELWRWAYFEAVALKIDETRKALHEDRG